MYSLQHRLARGAGGRVGGGLNTAANLILLCGSATSPGCHNLVENTGPGRAEAYQLGFAIRGEITDPAVTPIFRHLAEWVVPSTDGWIPAAPIA